MEIFAKCRSESATGRVRARERKLLHDGIEVSIDWRIDQAAAGYKAATGWRRVVSTRANLRSLVVFVRQRRTEAEIAIAAAGANGEPAARHRRAGATRTLVPGSG